MQVTSILKAGVIAAVVGFAGTAAAVPLNGSVNVQAQGISDAGPLNARTSYTAPVSPTFGTASGNFGGFTPAGSALTISSFTTTGAGNLTLSGSFGTFTSSSVFSMPPQAVASTATAADYFFLGTLVSNVSGFEVSGGPPNASFRATLARNGTGDNFTTSFSGVLAAPPAIAAVPEPASMALLGMGLLGMGLVRRKKAN